MAAIVPKASSRVDMRRAERAIATEPLVEPLYRLLMTTLHQAGRTAEVQTVYARCRKTLLEEDGRLPSPDTMRLLNSLRSQ